MDNIQKANNQATTTDHFHQAALHECWPGGPIVSSPQQCHEIERASTADRHLPKFALDHGKHGGDGTQFAGKTFKNGQRENDREKEKGRA